ncbi:MAG: TIGR00282 family metallophosphoesterase [Ignavibacteria bacterium]|nr:TIGR00282 family metallophosphoesterase [Ignavibacteria bacterium]
MQEKIKVLFIGDIIGEPGFNLTKTLLPTYVSKYKIDFVIANGENITEGKGIVEKDGKKLLELDINVLTGGNHTLDKIHAHKYLNETTNVLRPQNYPRGAYGHGFGVFNIPNTNLKIGIINLQGRVFMKSIDCPFRAFDWVYDKIKYETNIVFVDFHAEATAEKIAFGWHVNGRASVVVGTHTHVPTADQRILSGGTAYITDVGMTGPYDSVIGMKKEGSIKRFIYSTPQKYEVAEEDLRFSAVLCEIDPLTGKATSIKKIFYPEF